MKKWIIFLGVLILSVISIFLINNKRLDNNIQDKHANFIKNHPFQKTLKLSKKQRLAEGIPPNKYLEEKYLLEINPHTGRTHPENLYKIQQDLKQKRALKFRSPGDAIDNQWVERGPNNVGGRTRAILFDPNDNTYKRVFAGGVSGGLWVNDDITDDTSSWIRVGIDENLAVTCMAVDPNNSQIMYLGTGELYSPQQALGNGIWKSIDGGVTWSNIYKVRGQTLSGEVPGTYYITDIIVRDKDGNNTTTNDSEVFAAIGASFYSSNPINTSIGTNDYGIYKSTDNGANWSQVILDVNGNSVAPNDFEIGIDNTLWLGTTINIHGDGGGRIYSSLDGITFTLKHTITDGRRTEIALSKLNASTVYVLGRVRTVNGSNQLIAPFVSLLKTTDAFATSPTALSLPNDADTNIPANDFTRGQGFYNLVIEVDPTNDAIAYAGGIDLFRTVDSGTNWTQISKWHAGSVSQPYFLDANLPVPYVHADQHSWMFHPTDSNKAVIGNDGGVFYATSLSSASTTTSAISSRIKDYNITQFYDGAISQSSSPEYILGGSQDNGTQFFNNASLGINQTTRVFGGDGTKCFIDKDGAYIVVTYLYNRILRFDLPYAEDTYTTIQNDRASGSFVNAMDLDDNLNILYSNGSSHLARYTDITTNSPLRTNIEIKSGNPEVTFTNFTAIKVSPFTTSSSKVYLGTRSGKLLKVENANTTTQTITDISDSSFLGSISSIEFGVNEDEIMVTFYNFGVESIWFTDDGGTTWNNKEGDFPDINVRCILMNPLNTDEVIIGTELGVWNTSNFKDSSPNWNQSYNGMSNVAVTSLNLRTSDNTVLASSYGRGMYTGKFKGNLLTTWTGNVDTDWANASNWTNGLPTTNVDVKIPNTTVKPILNSAITIDNLSIETNAELTLNASAGLTVEENLTINGKLTINSSSTNSGSLIVKGTATGNITYNRTLGTSWHLVSSPVSGQNYDNAWVTANSIASGNINTNQRGIATYNNDTGSWIYMLEGQSATFMQGKGYSTLRTTQGNLTFTGSVLTTSTTEAIDKGTNNDFNLIGNVYPSYIPTNNDADNVNNFLTSNTTSLNELTVWLWNGSSYVPINHASSAQYIAPGQGFFVKSKPAGGAVSFTELMRSHQTSPFFKTGNARPEIRAFLTSGKNKKYTDIFYINNTTTGFDNGYDSTLYTGVSSNFDVFTKLVNEEKDLDLSIQSIPKDYTIVIPVGITAFANEELNISISAKNISADKNVYLEDKEKGVFVLIEDENTNYTFTSDTDLKGAGRFYIHTSSETLQTKVSVFNEVDLYYDNYKIYLKNWNSTDGNLSIFNLQGKEVLCQKLKNNSKEISVNNLSKGIYIVKIKSTKGFFTKKIQIY